MVSVVSGMYQVRFAVPSAKVVFVSPCPFVRAVAAVVPRSGKFPTSTPIKLRGLCGVRRASSSSCSSECAGGVRLSVSLSIRAVAAVVHRSGKLSTSTPPNPIHFKYYIMHVYYLT